MTTLSTIVIIICWEKISDVTSYEVDMSQIATEMLTVPTLYYIANPIVVWPASQITIDFFIYSICKLL